MPFKIPNKNNHLTPYYITFYSYSNNNKDLVVVDIPFVLVHNVSMLGNQKGYVMLTGPKVLECMNLSGSMRSMYMKPNGEMVIGCTLGDVKSNLLDAGWRGVSNLDMIDLKEMGLEVVDASYAQHYARKPSKRTCKVLVVRKAEG